MLEVKGAEFSRGVTDEARDESSRRPTILLVEDEEMIRNIMCEVLERAGYEVLPCEGPREGIDTCKQRQGPIDLLLTDVVMPGMNGREMADEIRKTLPGLPVVYMSGYAEDALVSEGQPRFSIEYLQKPFKLETLRRKLAEVLGGPTLCAS